MQALEALLPNESYLFLGDSLHMPYGDKSPEELRGFLRTIIPWFCAEGVKAIVMACNTSTGVGYELAQELAGEVPVVEVVTPTVKAALEIRPGRVGVIATAGTTKSAIYLRTLRTLAPELPVRALATPQLVPMIERDFAHGQIDRAVIAEALNDPELLACDTLILGCTHYPLIEREIIEYFVRQTGQAPRCIRSSEPTAKEVFQQLSARGLLQSVPQAPSRFYATLSLPGFAQATRLLLGREVVIQSLGIFALPND